MHHYIAIYEFKLELQSGNAQFGSKLALFFLCDLEIWGMTLQNNRAPLLCYIKLCASLHSHLWIQTGVTVWKRPIWVKIGDSLSCVTLKFDGWPWKNNRAPLLSNIKLCASFYHHMWIQTGWVLTSVTLTFDLWLWPFAWTSLLSMVIIPENFMMMQWQEHCETRTRWRRVKTLGQHQVGVNLQSHAQHQLWIPTWHIFHEFHKIMPG